MSSIVFQNLKQFILILNFLLVLTYPQEGMSKNLHVKSKPAHVESNVQWPHFKNSLLNYFKTFINQSRKYWGEDNVLLDIKEKSKQIKDANLNLSSASGFANTLRRASRRERNLARGVRYIFDQRYFFADRSH